MIEEIETSELEIQQPNVDYLSMRIDNQFIQNLLIRLAESFSRVASGDKVEIEQLVDLGEITRLMTPESAENFENLIFNHPLNFTYRTKLIKTAKDLRNLLIKYKKDPENNAFKEEADELAKTLKEMLGNCHCDGYISKRLPDVYDTKLLKEFYDSMEKERVK